MTKQVPALKIAIIRQYYTSSGGAERFTNAVLNLNHNRLFFTLITRKWNNQVNAILCNPFYIGRTWKIWSFNRSVCKYIHNSEFDIVQSHERITCADIYRAGDGLHIEWLKEKTKNSALKKMKIKMSPFHQYILHLEKKIINDAEIIAPSTMVRDEIISNYNKDPSRVHVIHNFVDRKRFSPAHRSYINLINTGLSNKNVNLLFSGSGYKRKGLKKTLDVLSTLPINYHLSIIGYDSNINYWKRYCKKIGVENRTIFHGPVENPEIYYANSDLLIHTAKYEPFGNVITEALASGIPAVVSNRCGAKDIISNGKNGFIVDDNIDIIKQKITHLVEHTNTKHMRKVCRQSTINHTEEKYSHKLYELYNAISKQ